MATDFLLAGYQAVKALLLADSSLRTATRTSGVRRFVWFDGADNQPEPERKGIREQSGGYPQLKLDWDGQVDDLGRAKPTFGNQRPGSTCSRISEETHDYSITITTDNADLIQASSVINDVKRIFRAASTNTIGGATAFIGAVRFRNEKTSQREAAGRYRRIVTGRLQVRIIYDGSGQVS